MSWLSGSSKVGLDEGYIKLADILLNGSGLKFLVGGTTGKFSMLGLGGS
jgi:hypothetical protein